MERIIGYLVGSVRGAVLLVVRMVVSLRYNISLGVLSVALAISLWLFVTDTENPERTDYFAGLVSVEAVNVPPDRAVFFKSQPSVSVRVSAPEDVFDRMTTEDFRAIVDLSGVTAREAVLPVRVTSFNREVEVVEVSPSRLSLSLESLTSKVVPVRVHEVGAPPLGFEVASRRTTPEQVIVSGAESLVSQVDAAEADVNLTGVRIDVSIAVGLRARDERGGDIEGVTIQPPSAEVELELVQREFTQGFVVSPFITGVPAEGHNITGVEVDPPLVSVSGTAEVLQSIDAVKGVPTEEVSIDGAQSDVVRTVRLSLPEGARVSGREGVTVRVHIAAAQGQFTFMVAPALSGLASDLVATLAQGVVRVTVEGPVPTLNSLTTADIGLTLDVTGLSAGVHIVDVDVELPAGTKLVAVDPSRMGITLTSR
jgi:YbbR domain-containing protein